MAEKPSFNSWEPTWNRYGPLVYRVACAVEPHATEADRSVQITASAAAGFLDSTNVDPLAALLGELLLNCSAGKRIMAAEALIDLGVDADRATDITAAIAGASVQPDKLRKTTSLLHRLTRSKTGNSARINVNANINAATTAENDSDNGSGRESEPCATSLAMIPTFAVVRSHAIALWDQRLLGDSHKDPNDPTRTPQNETVTGYSHGRKADRKADSAAERDELARIQRELQQNEKLSQQHLQSRKRRRQLTVGGLLVFLLSGALAGKILVPRVFDRQQPQEALPLLTIRDLPKQWALTFATAHQPANVLNPTTVFQRFDSLDRRQTVLVTTIRDDRRFADASLGTPPQVDPWRSEAAGIKRQAEAIATDSFPVHTPANAPVTMQWKQPLVPFVMNQSETIVYLEARGIPSSDVRNLGRSLTARRNLLENGWSTPKGFTEQIVKPQRVFPAGIQSSLIIKSTLDGNTRVMLQMTVSSEPTIATDDLREPRETITLPSGRVVKFSRVFTHIYSWTESGYEIIATVYRNGNDERTGGEATQQTRWFYNFVEPLPNRHLDGILDLLDRVQLGNDEQWRALTAGYQASLQSLPSVGAVELDGHPIVTRILPKTGKEKADAYPLPYALCAYSVCAPIYQNWSGLNREADLLIDDHWWHFRQIAKYDKRTPKYFTSPSVDSFKTGFRTGEASLDRVYKWWGIDFGTKVTAARNADEPLLLLRPLPR